MVKDTQELAENKLIILYILQRANLPLSNEQITEIIVDTDCMNYFLLQQYLVDLQNSEHILFDKEKSCYYITPKGTSTLNMFLNLISPNIKDKLDKFIVINRDRYKRELQITADYKRIADKQYIVTCKAEENNMTLIELKLNVVSKDQAKLLCKNWREKAQKVYSKIMEELINN